MLNRRAFIVCILTMTNVTQVTSSSSVSLTMTAFQRVANLRRSLALSGHGVRSMSDCAVACVSSNECHHVNYHEETNACELCSTDTGSVASDSDWDIFVKEEECNKYLVTGPDGVSNSQLSESSYWCQNIDCYATYGTAVGMSARYSRLDSTGTVTGSWTARSNNPNEWIQVDFQTVRIIAGFVLQGRHNNNQYVTKFKVLYSFDCANFIHITDETGAHKSFEGSTSATGTVIRLLSEWFTARCLRINPIEWEGYVSLRFDVLGC